MKYGGIRYLEAAHIKDFICLLRIANHPADQLSWFRILKLLEGVGPVTARRAIAGRGDRSPALVDVVRAALRELTPIGQTTTDHKIQSQEKPRSKQQSQTAASQTGAITGNFGLESESINCLGKRIEPREPEGPQDSSETLTALLSSYCFLPMANRQVFLKW